MKLTHILHAKNILLMSLIAFLFVGTSLTGMVFTSHETFRVDMVDVTASSSTTTMYVDPPSIVSPAWTPGTTFSVDVNIADVEELGGWTFYMNWTGPLLNVTSVAEGAFLKSGGSTYFVRKIFNEEDYILINCILLGAVPPSGSGILATVTFLVEGTGESALDLYGTLLIDFYFGIEIPHTVEDGYFNNVGVTQYVLTIGVVGSGTTVPSPGVHTYAEGTDVSVDAQPDSGYMLDYWLLDSVDVGSVDPYTVTMNDDHALTAYFVVIPPVEYDLTIGVVGSGTTVPSPGVHTYAEGTDVSVDAQPDSGYMLDYWLLDSVDVGSVDPYTVTMNDDHALTAYFVVIPPVEYDLTIGVVGSGTTVPSPGVYVFEAGEEVEVASIPDSGYMLDYWLLDSVDVGSVDPYTVTMNDDHALTAVFVEIPPTSVYVDPPTSVANPGESFMVNINVDDVVGLSSWEVKLSWNATILYTDYGMIAEGDFLSNVGMTYLAVTLTPEPPAPSSVATVGCMLLEPVTASGSGTLATVEFSVISEGECALNLYDTILLDVDLVEIGHTEEDGYFSTPPDFSISASPTSLTIQQGSSDTATVTVTSLNGFNSAVSLSISGLPTGVTATFDPTSVTPPADATATSTLTITVDATTALDTYSLTITGTSGSLIHTTSLSLTITELPPEPDFNISASPNSLTIIQGESDTSTITITSLHGFSSAVTLSVSGAPTGVTTSFDVNPVMPPSGGTAASTLTISVDVSTVAGAYTLTVTGTYGTLTHTVDISLTVSLPPDFSISASPTSLTIARGGSDTSTITVTSINGFNSAVTLSVSGAPASVTTVFSANPITPPPDGTATSTLTMLVDIAATPGIHTLTVTGTSGTLSHSIDVTLEITESVLTIDNLIDLVEEFYELGYIDDQGVEFGLLDKLYAAEGQMEKGKTKTVGNILKAFINMVEAQSGKHIEVEAADILLEYVNSLIQNL